MQRGSYRISRQVLDRLRGLKLKYGFQSYESVIIYFMNTVEREGMVPPATYQAIFTDSKPVIITGPSGSGKTTAVKELIRKERNVFVIDVANEYDLQRLNIGDFFGFSWSDGGRYRFVPGSNLEVSRAEAGAIFQHLEFIKNSGVLKDWTVVIEEGHRFRDDANLRALLIEARKFVRKLIIVTTDWQVYRDIAQVYKPA
ncbi:MAG: hypothetical protein JRM72_07880 [Nitrososphaerota archaeon]|nr:hypothetical protein [Nitrososphaerota archaeon]MDG7040880.1 hypothetical protein [Nitrososphaerota archaeon]